MNKYEKILMWMVGLSLLLNACASLPAGGVPPLPPQVPIQILPGQVELAQPGTTLDMLMRAIDSDDMDTLRMAKDSLVILGGRIKGIGWGFACFNGDSPCSYQLWKLLTGGKANITTLEDYQSLVQYLKVWCGWDVITKSQVPAGLVKSIRDGFAAKMGSMQTLFILIMPIETFQFPGQFLPTPSGVIE